MSDHTGRTNVAQVIRIMVHQDRRPSSYGIEGSEEEGYFAVVWWTNPAGQRMHTTDTKRHEDENAAADQAEALMDKAIAEYHRHVQAITDLTLGE